MGSRSSPSGGKFMSVVSEQPLVAPHVGNGDGCRADSPFVHFLRERAARRTYLEPMQGNNGDGLILLTSKYLLNKLGVPVVGKPEDAEQIFINGGGAMNDVGGFGVRILESHRTRFPKTPLFI